MAPPQAEEVASGIVRRPGGHVNNVNHVSVRQPGRPATAAGLTCWMSSPDGRAPAAVAPAATFLLPAKPGPAGKPPGGAVPGKVAPSVLVPLLLQLSFAWPCSGLPLMLTAFAFISSRSACGGVPAPAVRLACQI